MKAKKLIAIFLVMTGVILTSCGKEADKQDHKKKTATKSEEKDKKEEVEETKEETDDSSPSEETDEVSLLHLNKDCKMVSYMDPETYVNYLDYSDERVILSEEDALRFPELAATLESELSNRNDTYQSYIDSLIETYEELTEYGSDIGYESSSKIIIERADTVVLSICEMANEYTGGAHGLYGSYGYNYDTKTGKALKFSDVVSDPVAFLNLANDKIQKAYSDEDVPPATLDEYLEDYDTSIIWTIDYQGVRLYFTPYTLGPYAMGQIETEIYFSEAPELFNEKYLNIPDSYVMELRSDETTLLDINNDGNNESVTITSNYNEYGYIDSADIEVEGETFGVYGEPEHFYFVSNKGKNYILFLAAYEGGYMDFRTIDLSTMYLDIEGDWSGFLAYFDYKSIDEGERYEDNCTEAIFTDPDKVLLSTYMQYLGTMTGRGYYHVNDEGHLVTDSGIYNIDMNNCLIANMDIDCEQVDIDGKVIGKAVIKEGTRLVVRRGDGKSFADLIEVPADADVYESEYYDYLKSDLKLEDADMIYRVSGELGEYGSQAVINGYEEYEVFSKILYAD